MTPLNTPILEQAIDRRKNTGKQSVDKFVDNVQQDVKKETDEMTDKYGDAVKDIAGEEMKAAQGYAEGRKKALEGDFQVDDLSKVRADGLCDMNSREVTVDDKYVELGETEAEDDEKMKHAEKVAKHEKTHQKKQAAKFDLDEVVLDPTKGEDGKMKQKDFIEGQAIKEGGQTHAELTPEYVAHDQAYQQLLTVVDESTVERAMETGKLSDVQEAIIDAKRDEFMKAMLDRQPHLEMAA